MLNYKEMESAKNRFVDIYKETCSGKVSDTVRTALDELGLDVFREVLAMWVQAKSWDGRIDRRNAEFFGAVEVDKRVADHIYGLDSIHPAHLDQIADEFRRVMREG